MNPRRARIAVLAVMPAACAAAAIVLVVVSSALTAEANAYWSPFSTVLQGPTPVQVDRYESLFGTATTLTTLAAPLLLAAVSGGFVLLAVLAARRDARPRRDVPRQTEADAAS